LVVRVREGQVVGVVVFLQHKSMEEQAWVVAVVLAEAVADVLLIAPKYTVATAVLAEAEVVFTLLALMLLLVTAATVVVAVLEPVAAVVPVVVVMVL
jgi:hypothetical protein